MFNIKYLPAAQRFLDKCPSDLGKRIDNRIERLKENPFPSDIKRVEGLPEKVFRIRIGDYRVQYFVDYIANTVVITDIDKRDSAYLVFEPNTEYLCGVA